MFLHNITAFKTILCYVKYSEATIRGQVGYLLLGNNGSQSTTSDIRRTSIKVILVSL